MRKEEDYFDDITDEKVPKDMLDLAAHIVDTKKAHWKPERFKDRYEDALKELLSKKQAGVKIEARRERAPSNFPARRLLCASPAVSASRTGRPLVSTSA